MESASSDSMVVTGDGDNAIDEGLYSRQLYVMGHEAQKRMASSDVLIIGESEHVTLSYPRLRAARVTRCRTPARCPRMCYVSPCCFVPHHIGPKCLLFLKILGPFHVPADRVPCVV